MNTTELNTSEAAPSELAPPVLGVLIADDHRLFREGLKGLISMTPGWRVVAEAGDGQQALDLALERDVQVVIMDIQMPGLSGLEATRRLIALKPDIGVLVLTMFEDDDNVFAAMQAGARGYLLKGAAPEELLRAIAAVAQGEALFDASIARRLIGYFSRPTRLSPALLPELTERERELLSHIAQGESNARIAARLDLAEKTVRNHITSIFSKLQVSSRAEAVTRAREAGL